MTSSVHLLSAPGDVAVDMPEMSRVARADSKAAAPRLEMPWSRETEAELENMKVQCDDLMVQHDRARRKARCMWITFGLPSMIIPLVTGGAGSYITAENEWVRSAALILTATNSALLQFFNFSEKRGLHNEAAGKFDELGDLIHLEIHKPRDFRLACDVFMERVFTRFQTIKATAPPV